MYIKARVKAGAKEEGIEEIREGEFRISVRQKAERNMANTRVRELIASHFRIATAKVRIINGHFSPNKMLSVQSVGTSSPTTRTPHSA